MARRLTIDLTDAAEAEVERLRTEAGLSTPDLFRHALSVYRMHNQSLKVIKSFAEGHHAQMPAHVLLHSLTVDIPAMCEQFKDIKRD